MALVPVSEDAKKKTYYKYYKMGIPDLSEEQKTCVNHARRNGEKALLLKDINKALVPDMFCPDEIGYYYLQEGGVLIANNIPMPGITPEMLYWWFAWHPLEPLRYSIWDPEEHYSVEIDEEGRRRSLDPQIRLEEKTWGAEHLVVESLAPEDKPVPIKISFRDPKEMGIDASRIGSEGCAFIVAANALNDGKIPSVMLETAKKMKGIMHYQVYFWIGYQIIDGQPVKCIPDGMEIPEIFPRLLLYHSTKEFSHLARILPQVYGEEKNNW